MNNLIIKMIITAQTLCIIFLGMSIVSINGSISSIIEFEDLANRSIKIINDTNAYTGRILNSLIDRTQLKMCPNGTVVLWGVECEKTLAKSTNAHLICNYGDAVRWRDDGILPTKDIGVPLMGAARTVDGGYLHIDPTCFSYSFSLKDIKFSDDKDIVIDRFIHPTE